MHLQGIKALLLIGGVSVITRLPCLLGDFLTEDLPAIVYNQDVSGENASWTSIFTNDFHGGNKSASHKPYRPLTTLTFRLNVVLFGNSSLFFHLVNMLLHTINCLLAYQVVKKWETNSAIAFYSALLFSVHPLLTETVCSVTGRAELLWSLSALMALLVSEGHDWMVMFFSSLGVLTKEWLHGVMIIPMIIFVQLMKAETTMAKSTLIKYFAFLAISLYLRVNIVNFSPSISQDTNDSMALIESKLMKLINFQYLLTMKFWTTIFPDWLCHDWYTNCFSPIYSVEDRRIYSSVLFWLMIASLAKRKMLCLTLVFSAMMFLPGSNVLQNIYLPALGISTLIAQGYHYLVNRAPGLAKLTYILALLSFAMQSIHRGFDWQTNESLYKSCLTTCPTSKMYFNVAKVAKDKENAMKYYENALELNPYFEDAMLNLGQIYKNVGRFVDAEDLYTRAFKSNPMCTACLFKLGLLYHEMEKYVKAIHHFEKTIEHDPEHIAARKNLALSRRMFLIEFSTIRKQVEKKCGFVKVTSPKDPTKSTGTYNICKDCFAVGSPDNPVWWLDADEFRYLFNNGSKDGWRIGNEDGLKTGSYFYKSNKNDHLPADRYGVFNGATKWESSKASIGPFKLSVYVKCSGTEDDYDYYEEEPRFNSDYDYYDLFDYDAHEERTRLMNFQDYDYDDLPKPLKERLMAAGASERQKKMDKLMRELQKEMDESPNPDDLHLSDSQWAEFLSLKIDLNDDDEKDLYESQGSEIPSLNTTVIDDL